ncbi:hypothetical protein M7775_20360 [Sporomusa sphaeroides DSM 2875]|uniref:hypothetical protein n=1 Tax=Sporomusa sphaeroides TaxID=47679 RepID=UPI00202FC7AA|nr:hypothetical protein [Sporomusa sphaeroides]MCM0760906.1 hypothetical protein [Sporomusa sphaeroides DSM 2875]
MSEFIVKRQFQGLLSTGIAATAICLCASIIFWPVWALLSKGILTILAGSGLQSAEPKVAAKLIANFAEGTFFFMVINSWVWQILLFGGYGKTYLTARQPYAGIWYTFVGLVTGLVFLLILAGFLGMWWKPFSLAILLTPKTAEEVHLAIEGWEIINFYTLAVLLAQIPAAALFHKWPFGGNIKAPWDGFGVMMTSTAIALLVWMGTVIPSLAKLQLGGHDIFSQPFGSWPAYLAFAQAFVWCFLIPAEGGEQYPMKLFAKKQPYMGIVGLLIALIGGLVIPPILRPVVGPLNLLPGVPVDLVITSLEISVIFFTLLWHHLFDDYPTAQMSPNQTTRIVIRIAIWVVGGFAWGVIWLKIFKMLPFGANDLGLGYPAAGMIAGQFVAIMMFVIMNTYFDKWPLVKKIPVESNKSATM